MSIIWSCRTSLFQNNFFKDNFIAFINPLFYWESQMYLDTRIADIFITIGMTLTSEQNISRMPSRIKLRSLLIPLSLPIAFKKRFCCNDFHLNLWPSCSLINILSHKSYIGNISYDLRLILSSNTQTSIIV